MTPECEVVPFPAARRVGFIRKQARLMAHYNPDAAERTLTAQLNAQRAAMLRRGIPPRWWSASCGRSSLPFAPSFGVSSRRAVWHEAPRRGGSELNLFRFASEAMRHGEREAERSEPG